MPSERVQLDTAVINCQAACKAEVSSQLKRLREEHPNMPLSKWKVFAEKRFKKLRRKGVDFLISHGGRRHGEDDASDEVEEELLHLQLRLQGRRNKWPHERQISY